jgi:hypothetical protein
LDDAPLQYFLDSKLNNDEEEYRNFKIQPIKEKNELKELFQKRP